MPKLSIARIIEPAVATNIEPPQRVQMARLSVASGQHHRGQDVGEEDGLVAVRAGAAEAEATAEDVAVWAALLAEEACLAARAFVDGVGDEGLSAPGRGGPIGEIGQNVSRATEPVGALLAGVGAVAGAGRNVRSGRWGRHECSAQWSASRNANRNARWLRCRDRASSGGLRLLAVVRGELRAIAGPSMTSWCAALARRSNALLPRIGSSNRPSHSSTPRFEVRAKLLPMPFDDQVVQVFALLSGEPVQGEVVEDQQIWCEIAAEGCS